MKFSKPTMADVAKLAGVSPTTAARVVHQNGYVSAENREEVLRAVTTLGYRPNLQARSLRLQRSQTIGLIYSDQESPVHTKLAQAIRTRAAKAGLTVLTVDYDPTNGEERDGISQFLDRRVDAVISSYAFDPAAYLPLQAAGIPLIQIERARLANSHFVAYDQMPGLEQAVSALTTFGHCRIGFIGGSDTFSGRTNTTLEVELERAEIFRLQATAQGLDLNECPVVLGDYFARDAEGRLAGDTLAHQLLDKNPDLTAIIAGSDILAAGILQALYTRHLRVPDDISLIGYDDSIADMLTPPLSSILQPYEDIANAAIEMVGQAAPEGPFLRRVIATRLVSRQSVGPARR